MVGMDGMTHGYGTVDLDMLHSVGDVLGDGIVGVGTQDGVGTLVGDGMQDGATAGIIGAGILGIHIDIIIGVGTMVIIEILIGLHTILVEEVSYLVII